MKFVIFYKGPETPPDASHKGWPAWFNSIGKALIDHGSPLSKGAIVQSDGSTAAAQTNFNGYSIIEAKDMDHAIELLKDHPYLTHGSDYSIELFKRG